ncbi:MAG: succinate dehydrogenase cytochrome b556 subunit [Gammaproteobacteria bacterium]|nr:MAG: succinate dehydrogenase cytochrome b556 subunit [Gammaproteobacteria bacterium]
MSSPPNRPLSPHLQIYRLPLLAWLSITHRITGVALALCAILLPFWLWALATGGAALRFWTAFLGHPATTVLLLLPASAALIYHALNGLRHLVWDTGANLSVPGAYRSGYLLLAATVVLTALFWWRAL